MKNPFSIKNICLTIIVLISLILIVLSLSGIIFYQANIYHNFWRYISVICASLSIINIVVYKISEYRKSKKSIIHA